MFAAVKVAPDFITFVRHHIAQIENQLLKIVFHMLKYKTHSKDQGADYVDNRRKAHLIKHHLDALKDLGVDMPSGHP